MEAVYRKLLSIIVPVYNEEGNIRRAYEAILKVFEEIPAYDIEIIFTDNHSEDRTFLELAALAEIDPRVRVVRFARNFGFNRSVLTGYRLAHGQAAIQLDCDLQDPPTLFKDFISLWEKGHDVVVGIRRNRKEPRALLFCRRLFYRILERFSDDNMIVDGGDFRLIDRSIIERLRWIDDAEPYTRALTSMFAVNQMGVPYDREDRQTGKSKFPIRRLFGLAMEGFLAHSVAPLRISSIFGVIVAVGTLILALFYILLKLLGVIEGPEGFTTISVLLLFGTGLNAIFLGIIGEYLGRIYNQMRRRPLTIVEAAINFSAGQPEASDTGNNWQHWLPPQAAVISHAKQERTDV